MTRDSSAFGSNEKLNTTTTRSAKNNMELMASFERHSRRMSFVSVARVMPVGALIIGALAERLGAPAAVMACATALALVALLTWIVVPRLRQLG